MPLFTSLHADSLRKLVRLGLFLLLAVGPGQP